MRSMLRLRLRGLDRSAPAAQLLSVPAAITWEAMRWAKAQGLRWFDFGGLRAPTLRALLDGETDSEQAASGTVSQPPSAGHRTVTPVPSK